MSFVYKGLKARLDRHIVTSEEIDHQIQRLLQQYPRIALVTDRPTQAGDEVVLDYAGYCDGEQFAGGTAENQTLVLGSGMFIPGFEEQLVDKVVEEPVTVKVTFPESYHAENLAGKEARFECVIHQIRVKTAYELDDIFARAKAGHAITWDEQLAYHTALLLSVGKEYAKRDWVTQFHFGCLRDNSKTMFRKLGPDTGYDCINNYAPSAQLADFLNALIKTDFFGYTFLFAFNRDIKLFPRLILGCSKGNYGLKN